MVRPEALGSWSSAARSSAGRLTTTFAGLDGDVARLAPVWSGAAATAFAHHQQRWHAASAGLLTTLTRLITLVNTAETNYRAAATANAQIWSGTAGTVTVAPAAAGGRGGIDAETEDIRAAVVALVEIGDALARAWAQLAAALAPSTAMAGDDDVGSGFGRDHDAMVAASWSGWRGTTILVDALAGGLAQTGNNIITAERASGAGTGDPITASAAPVPAPAAPPGSIGDNGNRSLVPPLSWYWPTADPALLRAAAAAWRSSCADLRDLTTRARATVTGLVAANPDPALEQMRTFTDQVLSPDPVSGLVGVLQLSGIDLADACERLADATEQTRTRMRAVVASILDGDEWFHPVAAILDAVLTRGMAHLVAIGGDALMLDLRLSEIHDDHARTVALIRHEIGPAAVDHLARLSSALVPPTPVVADTCAVISPAGSSGAPLADADRQSLINELVARGTKINAAEVLHIARAPDGRIVWIERGNGMAGLSHILRAGRIRDFLNIGVSPTDVPRLAIKAVMDGMPLGQVGKDGVAYDVDIGGGRRAMIVVIVGSNGFVVSAYPAGKQTKIVPFEEGGGN
ncbi:WXG100 family type VII secretion target [Pseudonocardia sp. GCM10023141]|uniref:WXG100 family type VII secretion target n=1 Tax=Pseudonocardia sp. GCM10023141 TaxID=3252653 RepID=UPI00360C3E99